MWEVLPSSPSTKKRTIKDGGPLVNESTNVYVRLIYELPCPKPFYTSPNLQTASDPSDVRSSRVRSHGSGQTDITMHQHRAPSRSRPKHQHHRSLSEPPKRGMSAVIGNPTPEETNERRQKCLYTFRICHLVIVIVAEPHVDGEGTPHRHTREKRTGRAFTRSHLQPVNINSQTTNI